MVGTIGIGDLCALDIKLDDAEATDQISIDAIDANAANRLVARDGFGVEIADVNNVTLGIDEVDIRVTVDNDETLGLWTPADEGDVGVVHAVSLIVGLDRLVVLVVLVQIVGSQDKKIVAGCLYVLHLRVG